MGDKKRPGNVRSSTHAQRWKLDPGATVHDRSNEQHQGNKQSEESSPLLKPPSSILTPLSDPARQIRLLHLSPDDQLQTLSMRMVVCEQASAPSYMAISYTWGNGERRRSIVVNDQIVEVNENCHYALWQTRLHFPSATIWIDSICIKQDDLTEKGHQVPAMGRIYANAFQVLACVGPHADDSQRIAYFVRPPSLSGSSRESPSQKHWWIKLPWWLSLWWQNVPPSFANRYGYHPYLLDYIAVIDTIKKISAFGKNWMLSKFSLKHKYLTGLLVVLNAFAQRSYWTRLWIVQELVNARKVIVLCGEHALPWTDIIILKSMSSVVKPWPRSCQTFAVLEDTMSTKTLSAEDLLTRFSGFGCQDTRDRLFGLLGLLRFSYAFNPKSEHGIDGHLSSHGFEHLPLNSTFADYTKSHLDCALQLTKHVRFPFIQKLLVAFEVDTSSAEFSQLVTQRRIRRKADTCGHIISPRTESCLYWHDPSFVADFCTIKLDFHGNLTASLSKRQLKSIDPTHPSYLLNAELVKRVQRHADATTHEVIVDGELAAITCQDARVGDLLVVATFGISIPPSFDIIGQGFAVNGYRVHRCTDHGFPKTPTNYHFGADEVGTCLANLQIGSEDAVVLVGQDFVDADQYNVEARICRLSTSVTSENTSSAWVNIAWCTNGMCTDEDKMWQYP
ncbi:hypothetical protein Q7P35_003370 [Cladosporium inversicolor]